MSAAVHILDWHMTAAHMLVVHMLVGHILAERVGRMLAELVVHMLVGHILVVQAAHDHADKASPEPAERQEMPELAVQQEKPELAELVQVLWREAQMRMELQKLGQPAHMPGVAVAHNLLAELHKLVELPDLQHALCTPGFQLENMMALDMMAVEESAAEGAP